LLLNVQQQQVQPSDDHTGHANEQRARLCYFRLLLKTPLLAVVEEENEGGRREKRRKSLLEGPCKRKSKKKFCR